MMSERSRLWIVGGGGVVLGSLLVLGRGLLGGSVAYDPASGRYATENAITIAVNGSATAPALYKVNQEFVSVSGVVKSTSQVASSTDPSSTTLATTQSIVLERACRGVDDLYRWRLEVEQGSIVPRDVAIKVTDADQNVLRSLTLQAAWPSKWEKAPMKANSTEPGLERIVLSAASVADSAQQ